MLWKRPFQSQSKRQKKKRRTTLTSDILLGGAATNYAFVALHRLFLVACGADTETETGGDVKIASKILHVGGTIARGWQREGVSSHGTVLPDSFSSEQDLRNREGLRRSAERLVRDTITKALVESVSREDAEFRARVSLAIEARKPKDDSESEQTEIFSEFVLSYTRHLLVAPQER